MTIISCRPLQYSGSTPDCGFGNPGSTPGKGIHFYTTNNVKERKRRKKKLFKYRKRQKEREREREREKERERKGKAKPFKLSCFFIYQNIL